MMTSLSPALQADEPQKRLEAITDFLTLIIAVYGHPVDERPVVTFPPGGVTLAAIEREAIVTALKMTSWVQKDAAALLDVSPRSLNYKIKYHGIQPPVGPWGHGGPRWRSEVRKREIAQEACLIGASRVGRAR